MKESKLKIEVDSDRAVGTSYHDDKIDTTVKLLKKVLGKPTHRNTSTYDKVQYEWVRETVNGDIFTVYDWKEYRRITQSEEIEFHIGGNNKEITTQALTEITLALGEI